ADLRHSVFGRGLGVAALGGVIGIAGAMITNRVLAATLFEVGAVDTIALGASVLLLMTTCVVACALPARMATRIDPVSALRATQ
ncbi:MAG: hypothetical protein M3081_16645, partial [Gemmatimonadota bacterium]|nr:hypothetical protein [Gemmatimonadota bacterium]